MVSREESRYTRCRNDDMSEALLDDRYRPGCGSIWLYHRIDGTNSSILQHFTSTGLSLLLRQLHAAVACQPSSTQHATSNAMAKLTTGGNRMYLLNMGSVAHRLMRSAAIMTSDAILGSYNLITLSSCPRNHHQQSIIPPQIRPGRGS